MWSSCGGSTTVSPWPLTNVKIFTRSCIVKSSRIKQKLDVRFLPNSSKLSCLSAGVLLRRLLHAFRHQRLELRADLLGLAIEFVQELALLVINLAIGKDHPTQPGGLFSVDQAAHEHVVLDRLVEELLEGRRQVLHPLVQFDEEVGLRAADLILGVHPLAQ